MITNVLRFRIARTRRPRNAIAFHFDERVFSIILAVQRKGGWYFEPNERKSTRLFIPPPLLLPIHTGCKLNFVTTCNLLFETLVIYDSLGWNTTTPSVWIPSLSLWILNTTRRGAKKRLDTERWKKKSGLIALLISRSRVYAWIISFLLFLFY